MVPRVCHAQRPVGACPGGILGRETRTGVWEVAWCEPCSRWPTARASSRFARDLLVPRRRGLRHGGDARCPGLRRAWKFGRSSDLTGTEAIAGGQVKTLHPAIYAGILARRDQPEQLAELKAQGIGLIDLVAVNVSPLRAAGRRASGPDRRGHRDDRRRRRRPARGRGPQLRRGRGRGQPGPLRRGDRRDARPRVASRRNCARGWPRRPSGWWPPTTPRSPPTSRTPAGRLSPAAWPWCWRRSRTCTTARTPPSGGLLPRDDAPGRHAGRRRRGCRARSRRSTTCWTWTRPTPSPPTSRRRPRSIVKHTDPVGLASADDLVEAYRHALETDPVSSFGGIVGVNRELDGATAREIAVELLRGGGGAGLQPGRPGHPGPEAADRLLAVPPDPDSRAA